MKNKLLPVLISSAVIFSACDDTNSIVIGCYGDRCEDIAVDDPDAEDSKEGDPNPDDNDGPKEDPEDPEEPEEPENPTEQCAEGEDDCANVPSTCDICFAGNRKCEGNTLLVCQKNKKGCLTWTTQENCEDSQSWCDSTLMYCTKCENTCQDGDWKCSEDGVMQCGSDNHGCKTWNLKTPCSNDTHCDDITMTCVDGCVSNCHEGERKCDGSNILSCQKSAQGCFVWEIEKTCDAGQTCTGSTPVCEKSCGTECEPFSLILMPDTQHYVLTKTGIQKMQTQWIADNQKKENIRMVMHLGDISDGNKETHFERAVAAQNVLVQAGVPFTISTGNHDYKKGYTGVDFISRDRSLFSRYFNDAYFQNGYHDSTWFGGFYNSANMYATFTVGNLKFAVIALEFFPRKESICWAESLISNELRNHYVIITTHGYLDKGATKSTTGKYTSGSNGDIHFGAVGSELWSELISRHSNIIMAISGHVSGSEYRARTGNNGNTIHEMLVDYQSEMPCTSSTCSASCGAKSDGGNGWMRMLKIDPVNTKNADGSLKPNVTVTTFSVLEHYQNKKTMFCSDVNSNSTYNYYDNKSTKPSHSYSFALDLTTPPTNKYDNKGAFSFITGSVNETEDDTNDGNQYNPVIAMNRSNGAFVVAWEDDADKNEIRNIQAKIFCAGGCSNVRQIAVSSGIESTTNPDIAIDAKGNFVVVWEDSASQIYMRGYDSKGKERIPEQKIAASGKQNHPAIAMNADGDFVVAWQDSTAGENTPQIFMRGFNANGSERFASKNVTGQTDGSRRKPDIGMADDGTFVVTWEDDPEMDKVYQIRAKGFTQDGAERIPEFTVNSVGAGQQLNPAIGMNQSGTFYIAFEDDNDGNKKFLIIARGFDKNGKEIKADTTLSASNEETADPSVCVAEDGTAIFTWTAKALNESDVQIRIIENPEKIQPETRVHKKTPGPQRSSSVGCTADGNYVVVFSDDWVKSGYSTIAVRGFDKKNKN